MDVFWLQTVKRKKKKNLTFPVSTDKSFPSLLPTHTHTHTHTALCSLSLSLPFALGIDFDMQAVGEKLGERRETHTAYGARRPPSQFRESTDSEGRELETCYEKMRRWLTVGCQLGCLATTNGSAGHAPVSLSLSLSLSSSSFISLSPHHSPLPPHPPLHPLLHGAEKWGKAEAPIA